MQNVAVVNTLLHKWSPLSVKAGVWGEWGSEAHVSCMSWITTSTWLSVQKVTASPHGWICPWQLHGLCSMCSTMWRICVAARLCCPCVMTHGAGQRASVEHSEYEPVWSGSSAPVMARSSTSPREKTVMQCDFVRGWFQISRLEVSEVKALPPPSLHGVAPQWISWAYGAADWAVWVCYNNDLCNSTLALL